MTREQLKETLKEELKEKIALDLHNAWYAQRYGRGAMSCVKLTEKLFDILVDYCEYSLKNKEYEESAPLTYSKLGNPFCTKEYFRCKVSLQNIRKIEDISMGRFGLHITFIPHSKSLPRKLTYISYRVTIPVCLILPESDKYDFIRLGKEIKYLISALERGFVFSKKDRNTSMYFVNKEAVSYFHSKKSRLNETKLQSKEDLNLLK